MAVDERSPDRDREPWITGAGMTPFSGEHDEPLDKLLENASLAALDDAGVGPEQLDLVVVGNMAAEAFSRQSGLANILVGSLGAYGASARRVESTSASGASAFESGVRALRSGAADYALVVGGEKMSTASTARSTEIVSRITHRREREQGVTLPGLAGLAADAYLDRYGAGREELARVPVKNHRNAVENEVAHFRKRIDVDDVIASPLIAEPLRLYDCCPTTDGAAAVVLQSGATGIDNRADGANDLTTTSDDATATPDDATATPDDSIPTPRSAAVRVAGVESAVDTHAVGDRPDVLSLGSVERAGMLAFESTDLTPGDVDLLCLHDAFSILEWLELEALGFHDHGSAWEATVEGVHDVDGALPVNPGGGLKARGHPIGATGLSQIVEAVWQLRGEVPAERAVANPSVALALNLAGFGNNAVCTLLSRS